LSTGRINHRVNTPALYSEGLWFKFGTWLSSIKFFAVDACARILSQIRSQSLPSNSFITGHPIIPRCVIRATHSQVYVGVPSPSGQKQEIPRYIGPRPLRPTSFLIQYSLIILPFDTFRLRVAGNGVRMPVGERDNSLLQNAYNSGTAAHAVS
jgi:hypothetical protein